MEKDDDDNNNNSDNNDNNNTSTYDPDIFFNVLQRDFPSLLSMIIAKPKFTILVPLRHLIIPRMLQRNFYDNHIVYVSPYDEGKYINLNGKVLKVEDKLWTGVIGWQKPVQFSFKEKIIRSFSNDQSKTIEYIAIDNLCDDFYYKMKTFNNHTADINKFPMSVFPINEAYINYYYQPSFASIKEYLRAEEILDTFIEIMNNHYMLTQGNEMLYFKQFNDSIECVINSFKEAIKTSFKVDILVFDQVTIELVQSLIFSKKNYYNNIMNRLIHFSADEEAFLCEQLIHNKQDYTIEGLLGERYKSMQLNEAIKIMSELPDKITFFEKNMIYKRINDFFEERLTEINMKTKGGNREIGADVLINLWTILLSQWPIKNLIAELNFYSYFMDSFATKFDVNNYYSATILTALGKIRKDIEIKNGIAAYCLNQKVIQTVISIDKERLRNSFNQSQRLSIDIKRVTSRQSNS